MAPLIDSSLRWIHNQTLEHWNSQHKSGEEHLSRLKTSEGYCSLSAHHRKSKKNFFD